MKNKNKRKIILLDSHAILHRAYHALPDFVSSKGEPTGALFGLSTMLFSIIKEIKPNQIIATFDLPKPTYRHEVYKDYKAGRRETDSDLKKQFNHARDIFKAFNIPIYEKEGFEADDILGTISNNLKTKKDLQVIIASGDMDTLQLVSGDKVLVYTLKKGIKDTILYDEEKVFERFNFKPSQLVDYKGLRGDPSDNIIGVNGIGDKTATNLIIKYKTIEKIYKTIEKIKKANKEYFIELEKEVPDERILKKINLAGPEYKDFREAGFSNRILNLLFKNREEAEFSKMLATIRKDAPINFEIPAENWEESVDKARVKELFNELEFRSLVSRFESLFEENDGLQENKAEKRQVLDQIHPEEIEKTKVALWVLNSNLTNPSLEDIYNFTNTKNASEFNQAKKIIFEKIKKENLEFIYQKIEEPLIKIIRQMEKNGVKINKQKLKKLSKSYHLELNKIQNQIYKTAGQEFNINSPKQMSEVLFQKMGLAYKGMRKTSTGKYSTKEEVLHKLKDEGHKIAEQILDYREYQKLLSTYIDSFPKHVQKDERLRAKFSQTGTTTGRLSSNDPNLQNIPVGTEKGREIRKAFEAEKGKLLVAFDYSQIELRIAAFLSKDEKLIDAFKKGLDIHTAVASEVFSVDQEKVTKDQRRQAKVINFGILYGMGVTALQKNLGTDRKTAQSFYNQYFQSYLGLANYISDIKEITAIKKYTETLFGRRRYFDGFNSPLPFIRAQAERMAVNAPIQGTQADLIKLVMVKIDEYLRKEKINDKVKLILQIHDEVIYEIDEDLLKKSNVTPKIIKIMENILTKEQTHGVPIIAKMATGKNWGEMK